MTSLARIAAAAAALTLGACASTPPDLDDNMIVPGQRVGEVELGMSLSELFNRKGPPLTTIPMPNTTSTTYAFDGLTVAARDEVYWIIARDPRFRTEEGVGMGSEQILARGSYGKPDCVVSRGAITIYDYGDFYFEVENATGKVGQIGVQKKTLNCED